MHYSAYLSYVIYNLWYIIFPFDVIIVRDTLPSLFLFVCAVQYNYQIDSNKTSRI